MTSIREVELHSLFQFSFLSNPVPLFHILTQYRSQKQDTIKTDISVLFQNHYQTDL